MKSKTNIIIAVTALIAISAAYATCYMDQVVLCFKSGDNMGVFGMSDSGCIGTFTANVYANENAYRFDTYSVSRGGKTEATFTSYCDPYSTVNGEIPSGGNAGNGFAVYFYDSCTGNTFTTCNSRNNNYSFSYSATSHYADPSSACN